MGVKDIDHGGVIGSLLHNSASCAGKKRSRERAHTSPGRFMRSYCTYMECVENTQAHARKLNSRVFCTNMCRLLVLDRCAHASGSPTYVHEKD